MAKTSSKTAKAPKTSSKASKSKTTKRSRKSNKVVKEEPVAVVESVPEPVSEPVSAPVVAAVVAPVVAVVESKEEDLDAEWMSVFSSLITSQKTMGQSHRSQLTDLKKLQTLVTRRVKFLRKRKTKRGGGNQRKNPSGFNKPTDISPELSTFLTSEIHTELLTQYKKMLNTNTVKYKKSLEKLKDFNLEATQEKLKTNGKFARTEITSMMHMYIKGHNLQQPSDGRKFDLSKDDTLQKLLNVPADIEPTYFNLQSYLSRHFLKSSA